MDLTNIRKRLEGKRGQQYWRSLDELAQTPEFQEYLNHEFPQSTPEDWRQPLDRRSWMRLMGASLAFGGLTACTKQPPEKIVPYVKPPEEFSTNNPVFYATAHLNGGYAMGTLVQSHQGRPTKIEGNPQHPASFGSTDVFAQAEILTMYDPDRSQTVLKEGRISSHVQAMGDVALLREQKLSDPRGKGAGLRILTPTVTSPTLGAQLQALLAEMPQAKWHQYEAVSRNGARIGAKMAFGEYVSVQYKFEEADVVVSLDSAFLVEGPASIKYARDFTARRRAAKGGKPMNRMYAAEVTPTTSGTMADHRVPARANEIGMIAAAIAAKVGVAGVSAPAGLPQQKWLDVLLKDLDAHKGSSIVIAGDYQPAEVHALVFAINEKLGNFGKTMVFTEPVEVSPVDQVASLKDLVDDINGGKVDTILVLGGNPVYDAPADLKFREAFLKVPKRIGISLYVDETSKLCTWHIPQTHPLEAWGDARAFDGTVTILQPLILPEHGEKSAIEIVGSLLGKPNATGYDLVRANWRAKYPKGTDFETIWQTALHDGVLAGTAVAPKTVAVKGEIPKTAPLASDAVEFTFRPDPAVWDGRYSNNGWMQELPKPVTKVCWDNVAHVSPAMAQKLGVERGDLVEIKVGDASVKAPVWITPGQPKDSVTVHLGYGRTDAGRIGNDIGFNAYTLRTSQNLWSATGEIKKAGGKITLVSTQAHHGMEGRAIIRVGTEKEYLEKPDFAKEMEEVPGPKLTLYPSYDYSKGYSWALSVDLNSCIGCNACVIACQSENNISVVGKEEVGRGREMQWIRIDRYHVGDIDNPAAYSQPVMCQHCENASCETVCPVAATVHSSEGLNQMVYNRCIGTRYCSNNCPYKVRRFNFFLYADWDTKSYWSMRNPNVTVRSRGVMEKCSYCVQRINAAKIKAEVEDRLVKDGEIITACQQVCPTQAITFGNMNDTQSKVQQQRDDPRTYSLLAELNTRPRTTYMAKLRNPNPELEAAAGNGGEHGEKKG